LRIFTDDIKQWPSQSKELSVSSGAIT